MSNPGADDADPAPSAAGAADTAPSSKDGVPAPGAPIPEAAAADELADERDRSQTSEDASARDWADTGDPDREPVLPPGHPGIAPETHDGPALADLTPQDGASGRSGDPAAPPPTDAVPPADAPAAAADGEPSPGPAAVHDPATLGGTEPRSVVRATGPPRRPPLLVQGLWPALLAGVLAGCASVGLLPLAVAVLAVQVFLVLGALALLDAPASGGAFLVATGATLAADAAVLLDDGRVTGLAGAAGLGLVASLVHQLSRPARSRVTESLADTLVVVVVSIAGACLLALHQVEGGQQVLLVSLTAAGAVLLAGRTGDRLAPRPMLAIGSTRGWPGLLLGLGAGVAAALLVADAGGELPLTSAALLGLVVGSTVATADLAVDLGAAELRSGWRDARRVAALRPTALLLPYAVLGPVALLAGRLVLS